MCGNKNIVFFFQILVMFGILWHGEFIQSHQEIWAWTLFYLWEWIFQQSWNPRLLRKSLTKRNMDLKLDTYTFGPQNHEKWRFQTPNIWVRTPKNAGNVGSHSNIVAPVSIKIALVKVQHSFSVVSPTRLNPQWSILHLTPGFATNHRCQSTGAPSVQVPPWQVER